jgi:predicted metalloprotease with PDZ domain
VALAFDLTIRAQTNNRKSLDDVMRLLWQRFGRDFYRGKPVGVKESEIEAIFAEATGAKLAELFAEAVHGTRDLPLETMLEPFGMTLTPEIEKAGKPSLGARVRGGADCTLAAVHEGSGAQKAGLSAGDVLIAIDGLRATGANLDGLLSRYAPGDKVEVHAFRRDELRTTQVKLDGPEAQRYKLAVSDKRPASRKARERWLAS